MAAGPNLGESDSGTDNCTGDTGLKEGTTETLQNSGCRSGQGNFLKPVEAATGESYLLWINNFRNKGGLDITWTGTASFRPDPVHCTLSGLVQDLSKGGLAFSAPYPNPTSQNLRLDVQASADQNGQYQLFRVDGSLAMTRPCVLPAGSSFLDIATETLPTGVYFIKFSFGNAVHVVKFGKE